MRQWRVGTLTMGIILIVLGIVILLSQFNNASILNILLKWWPLSLILLGCEVLGYIGFSKSGDERVLYDGFSIFLIIIILMVTMGAYSLKTVLDTIPHNSSSIQFTIPIK